MSERLLLLLVGAGRSGTSLFAGTMSHLGFYVPPPLVGGDDSNPRGHFEPEWVVEFHKSLLAESQVTLVDGDPRAGQRALEVASGGAYRSVLMDWMASWPSSERGIVVKDPRTVWAAPLWVEVAKELGLRVVFITMLRPAAAVVRSHTHHYANWETQQQETRAETALVAGWINVNLRAEEVSRGAERVSIVYGDLLEDWRRTLRTCSSDWGIPIDLSAERAAARRVDDFLDPGLQRMGHNWEDSMVPASLRSRADALWGDLAAHARGELDDATYVDRLGRHRSAYRRLYLESEMITRDRVRRTLKAARKSSYQQALDDVMKTVHSLR